jgi:OOP family OmpA-OmpF porin
VKRESVAAAFAGLLVSMSSQTLAQQPMERWYVGGALGQTHLKLADGVVAVPGAAVQGVTQDEVETGYKVFAGYRFHRRAALEAGLVNFGEFHARNTTTGPSGTVESESKRRGWSLDALANWPLSEGFSLLARAGGLFSSTKTLRTASGSITVAPGLERSSRSELNFHWGLGVSWDFSRSFALRAEYEQAQNVGDGSTGEGNVSLFSAGLVLKF